MMIRELVFGMPAAGVTQGPSIGEQTWNAINVDEDGNGGNGGNGNGGLPPKFPWYLFGIVGAAIIGIRTKKVLDKERRG